VGKAAELIDMTRQIGAHPRIGATDVLPFIPLEGYPCRSASRWHGELARNIWERYRIPIYFYEAAATRPERVNLENIRKDNLRDFLQTRCVTRIRSPDIGEPRLHSTAGATAVARENF